MCRKLKWLFHKIVLLLRCNNVDSKNLFVLIRSRIIPSIIPAADASIEYLIQKSATYSPRAGSGPAKEFHLARNLLHPLISGESDFTWLLDTENLKPPQIMA